MMNVASGLGLGFGIYFVCSLYLPGLFPALGRDAITFIGVLLGIITVALVGRQE